LTEPNTIAEAYVTLELCPVLAAGAEAALAAAGAHAIADALSVSARSALGKWWRPQAVMSSYVSALPVLQTCTPAGAPTSQTRASAVHR
jgi:hypothetical protein